MSANSKPLAPATISAWLKDATSQLTKAEVPSARLDAELIAEHVIGNGRTWLIAHGEDELSAVIAATADGILAQRVTRIPLAYLCGVKEFYGRDFIVTSDVLIPRPETEALVELAKEHGLKGKIIDVGCGSGCLGITLALETGADLFATDISKNTLVVTTKNMAVYGVNATVALSNLLDNWSQDTFDVIAANLPYVNREWQRSPETDHEPALALFAHSGGLALIYQLIAQAPEHLVSGGHLLLEADPAQHMEIISRAQKRGFTHIESRDYAVLLQKS